MVLQTQMAHRIGLPSKVWHHGLLKKHQFSWKRDLQQDSHALAAAAAAVQRYTPNFRVQAQHLQLYKTFLMEDILMLVLRGVR